MTLVRLAIISAILSTFTCWTLLIAVMVDGSNMPIQQKPHQFVRMVIYTLPIPINISVLYVLHW